MNDIAKENTFTNEVRKFQTSDPAHADLFNDVNTSLLGNDIYLKEHLDNLENPPAEEIPIPEELEEIKDGDSYNVLLGKLVKAVNVLLEISDKVTLLQDTSFDEASTRQNIISGEKMTVILGKIRKYFSDLKAVSFSGSYNDLSNKPAIPTVPSSLPANGGNADTVDGLHAWQLGTLSENGQPYGTRYPLSCKWRLFGDGRYGLYVDEYETRVHYASAADKASNDGNGNNIVNTYATKSEVAGASSGDVTSVRGDVQVQNGLWYKVGRMVVFSIQYYISSEEIGAGTNIITGLPTPLSGYWYGVSGARVDAYAIVNGVLSIQNNRNTGSYYVSGSYIC